MIVTVTPNPGLDLTYVLSEASDQDVHRARSSTLEASGKGVNVSRALTAAGRKTTAVLPLGGATGRYLSELLDDEGVSYRASPQAGATRINTTALRPGGMTLKLNGPGDTLTPAEQAELVATARRALAEVSGNSEPAWLAVCGSLPPGVGAELVGELVSVAKDLGARSAVDASGDALLAALSAGADLLAPNWRELAEVEPSIVPDGGDLQQFAQGAQTLAIAQGTSLLISLGRHGAVFASTDRLLHGWAPPLIPVNTAGAGDALLAGWLFAEGDISDRLARAIHWGRSSCVASTTVDLSPGRDDAHITLRDLSTDRAS